MNTESGAQQSPEPRSTPPTKRYPRWAKLSFAFVAVALLLSQCVSIGFPTEGVVIDSATKKPMQGVWVSQGWYAASFCIPIPAPHSSCGSSGRIASAITQSDDQGRFRFARPDGFGGGRWGWINLHPSFDAITLGYKVDGNDDEHRSLHPMYRWQDGEIMIVMNRLTLSRVEVLANLQNQLHYSQYGRNMPGYSQVEQSLFEQMRVMEVTHEEWAQGIAYTWGDMSLQPTPQMLVERRAQAALKAPSVIKENYAPYARYVDYLKKREKP